MNQVKFNVVSSHSNDEKDIDRRQELNNYIEAKMRSSGIRVSQLLLMMMMALDIIILFTTSTTLAANVGKGCFLYSFHLNLIVDILWAFMLVLMITEIYTTIIMCEIEDCVVKTCKGCFDILLKESGIFSRQMMIEEKKLHFTLPKI